MSPLQGVGILTRVVDRRDESDGVVSLRLRSDTGLPGWTPGAHIDLVLPNGITRQYSLCGSLGFESDYRISVLREPESRGGSRYIHDHVFVGSEVLIRGPRNLFELRAATKYLFIAGGIGITPILPMIRTCADSGADWSLAYGGRTKSTMAHVDELSEYGERVGLYPQDERGLLPLDALLTGFESTGAVYVCGPGALIDAVCGEASRQGIDSKTVRYERFSHSNTAQPPGESAPFDVVLARSGITLDIGPDDSILRRVVDAGVEIDSECGEGLCGVCETKVLDGVVDHRDDVLNEDERDAGTTMMICVSRCAGRRLVLDL